MPSQKLKLGFLLDSFNVPAWIYSVIQLLANESSIEFVLVVLNEDKDNIIKNNLTTIVYSIYNRIDEKLFTKEPNPFAPKSAANLLSNTSIIKAHPIQKDNACFLKESDINSIRNYRLDILIKFGFDGLQLIGLDASKYGIWYYCHGDDRIITRGAPGFWEVVENWPETSSALIASGGKFFPDRVLFRSHFITYPLSPARHRSYYFWATTLFLSRQIALLQRLGEEKYYLETEKFNATPLPEIKRYEIPSNSLAMKSIAKIVIRLMNESIQRIFFTNQWFLLFNLKKGVSDGFTEFIKLQPPRGKYWADPHVARVNGKYYIFIEEFLKAKNKGHISVIELNEAGNWNAPIKVLEKDYHLSYPFIFKTDNKFYMVPESRANKTIDLYESAEFPYKWVFKRCLMENISAVDTTLIYFSNKWWLFTAMAENEAAAPNVELFLFYSDNLFSGEWIAHPRNPIVSDVKNARPAGSLFVKDGKLFRPSQDCSKRYGHGIDLNEIEVLTEAEYRERKTLSIRPDWDKKIVATHTFANCGNLTMIDAMTYTRKM